MPRVSYKFYLPNLIFTFQSGKWATLCQALLALHMYFVTAYVENGNMSLNFTPWDGLKAYQRGVTDPFFEVKMWDKNLI